MAVDTYFPYLLNNDPREAVKVLAGRVKYYNQGKKFPEDILKGYIIL